MNGSEVTRVDIDGDYWFVCCKHCGCKPSERFGHDDLCGEGCNDDEQSWL